ncbi:thiamine pyrophosphate-dependent enzyme [bacterium]|nr:thiamine pyrophosphate-dependent enzyme [bacterium]
MRTAIQLKTQTQVRHPVQPHPAGRSCEHGWVPEALSALTEQQALSIYRQIVYNREFELQVAEALSDKKITTPTYLAVGQEHIAATLAHTFPKPMVFAQHRAHPYYLSFGGDPAALRDELLGLDSGCAQGKGGSASIHDPAIPMFGHSGLMGDQIPIAVGAAIASGRATLAVTGDASVEEDYVFSAMGYAQAKQAPVLFVCEDNDLSILTPVATRRQWNMTDVVRSLGMYAVDIADDPWLIAWHIAQMDTNLPAFLNIRTCRHLWHAGAGCDGPPEWHRFELIQARLNDLGLGKSCGKIDCEERERALNLWKNS